MKLFWGLRFCAYSWHLQTWTVGAYCLKFKWQKWVPVKKELEVGKQLSAHYKIFFKEDFRFDVWSYLISLVAAEETHWSIHDLIPCHLVLQSSHAGLHVRLFPISVSSHLPSLLPGLFLPSYLQMAGSCSFSSRPKCCTLKEAFPHSLIYVSSNKTLPYYFIFSYHLIFFKNLCFAYLPI